MNIKYIESEILMAIVFHNDTKITGALPVLKINMRVCIQKQIRFELLNIKSHIV